MNIVHVIPNLDGIHRKLRGKATILFTLLQAQPALCARLCEHIANDDLGAFNDTARELDLQLYERIAPMIRELIDAWMDLPAAGGGGAPAVADPAVNAALMLNRQIHKGMQDIYEHVHANPGTFYEANLNNFLAAFGTNTLASVRMAQLAQLLTVFPETRVMTSAQWQIVMDLHLWKTWATQASGFSPAFAQKLLPIIRPFADTTTPLSIEAARTLGFQLFGAVTNIGLTALLTEQWRLAQEAMVDGSNGKSTIPTDQLFESFIDKVLGKFHGVTIPVDINVHDLVTTWTAVFIDQLKKIITDKTIDNIKAEMNDLKKALASTQRQPTPRPAAASRQDGAPPQKAPVESKFGPDGLPENFTPPSEVPHPGKHESPVCLYWASGFCGRNGCTGSVKRQHSWHGVTAADKAATEKYCVDYRQFIRFNHFKKWAVNKDPKTFPWSII